MQVLPKFGYALVANKEAANLLGTFNILQPPGTSLMVAQESDLGKIATGVTALLLNDFPVYL